MRLYRVLPADPRIAAAASDSTEKTSGGAS
jgi:hypothetical protein